MKRYHFRLAAVLRLRRMEEEQARETLSAANNRLRQAISERDVQAARYAALAQSATAVTLDGLRAEQHAAGLAASVSAQAKKAATSAAADAALARIAWTATSRQVKVLERLESRRREEHDADEQRAEVTEIDDLVTARYVRAHHDGDTRSRLRGRS